MPTNLETTAARPRRSVALVTPARYQHPLDAQTIAALRNTAGLEDLVRLYSKHFPERRSRAKNIADCVRVGANQLPEIHGLFGCCCRRLGVRPEPELFLTLGEGQRNAFTSGVERPFVTLMSDLVEDLSPAELEFVMGHELGHVRFGHVLYRDLAYHAAALVGAVPVFGGALKFALSAALSQALAAWVRAGEYTADRAGLLACQDLDTALRVLMKLAGVPPSLISRVNPAAFLEQAREYEELDSDWVGWLVNRGLENGMSHPWPVLRMAELKRWHDGGGYEAILRDAAPESSPATSQSGDLLPAPSLPFRCPVCAATATGIETTCPGCSSPLRNADHFRRCPGCRNECPPSDRFCEACGHALTPAAEGGKR
jgi:hypothetical protein